MARNRRNERGATLVMTALLLVALLGFAALAVDVGMLYSARTSAQHAADAAALAGATEFQFAYGCSVNPSGAGCGGYDVTSAAQSAAVAVAAQNSILGTTVSISPSDVSVDTVNMRVTVNVARTGANGVPTFFARVLPNSSLANISARATAEAYTSGPGVPAGNAAYCLKPIFVPNTVLAPDASSSAACTSGHVLFSSNGVLSPWASSNSTTLFGQNPYLIRPTDPSEALTPSQYYSLDFGGGANTFRCTLGNCLNECGVPDILNCSANNTITAFDIKTGNMKGPTQQGIADLLGTPVETWSQYQASLPSGTARNLAVAAVWDDCHQTIHSGSNQNVKVIGFIQVFIDGYSSDKKTGEGVKAHILQPVPCGTVDAADEGEPGPGPNGKIGVPIRLVQPQ